MANAGFQGHILFHQFQNRELSTVGYDVIEQISFNLLFLFSQGRLSLFPLGHRIIFIQPPAVHILLFAILVQIAKPIPPILALILAFSQNPISIVSPFSLIEISPLKEWRARLALLS